jgi:hypothetical protein
MAFDDAFNRHDVDAILAYMTGDCVFENTAPTPDAAGREVQAAVHAVWEQLPGSTPDARCDLRSDQAILHALRLPLPTRPASVGVDGGRVLGEGFDHVLQCHRMPNRSGHQLP